MVRSTPAEFGMLFNRSRGLIKADVGVEAAFAEIGGWDHHVKPNLHN